MPQSETASRVTGSEAILAVANVAATIAFYRDTLGFVGDWKWGDPPTFGGVNWGSARLMFSEQPELAARSTGNAHYFLTEGIEALYDRHRQTGVEIVNPLRYEPWGMLEYSLRDLNGYVLRFGQPCVAGQAAPPLPAPAADLTLVERLPTLDEYTELIAAVEWTQFVSLESAQRALEGSLYSVLARDGDRTVGMARVVGDGVMFFYVQDVMVLPDYQRRGVGTLLVNAAVSYFRTASAPRAFLGLFTGRGLEPFYRQWDFRGPEQSLYGMSVRK